MKNSNKTTDRLKQMTREYNPLNDILYNGMYINETLFSKIKCFYNEYLENLSEYDKDIYYQAFIFLRYEKENRKCSIIINGCIEYNVNDYITVDYVRLEAFLKDYFKIKALKAIQFKIAVPMAFRLDKYTNNYADIWCKDIDDKFIKLDIDASLIYEFFDTEIKQSKDMFCNVEYNNDKDSNVLQLKGVDNSMFYKYMQYEYCYICVEVERNELSNFTFYVKNDPVYFNSNKLKDYVDKYFPNLLDNISKYVIDNKFKGYSEELFGITQIIIPVCSRNYVRSKIYPYMCEIGFLRNYDCHEIVRCSMHRIYKIEDSKIETPMTLNINFDEKKFIVDFDNKKLDYTTYYNESCIDKLKTAIELYFDSDVTINETYCLEEINSISIPIFENKELYRNNLAIVKGIVDDFHKSECEFGIEYDKISYCLPVKFSNRFKNALSYYMEQVDAYSATPKNAYARLITEMTLVFEDNTIYFKTFNDDDDKYGYITGNAIKYAQEYDPELLKEFDNNATEITLYLASTNGVDCSGYLVRYIDENNEIVTKIKY